MSADDLREKIEKLGFDYPFEVSSADSFASFVEPLLPSPAPSAGDGERAAENLRVSLKHAIDIIEKHVPRDALGVNAQGNPDVPGGYEEWPLLDEYLHHMKESLAASEALLPSGNTGDVERALRNIAYDSMFSSKEKIVEYARGVVERLPPAPERTEN